MEQKKTYKGIYIFYVLFIVFMLHRLFFASSGMAEKCASIAVYPFFKVQKIVTIPFHSLYGYVTHVSDLQQQIALLQEQNADLQSLLIEQKSLQTFHEESQEVVDFAKRYKNKNKLLAQNLGMSLGSQEDYMLIDAGSSQGICKDNVVVYKNMIIGRVIEVYPSYSKVVLITDTRCKIAAQSKKNVTGICCGKNNGQLEFNFVPHYQEVLVGDTITSTGKGLIYPKGFALAQVTDIQSDNVSHYIQAKPFIDFSTISYVYVMNSLC